jgi:hypothetical protein
MTKALDKPQDREALEKVTKVRNRATTKVLFTCIVIKDVKVFTQQSDTGWRVCSMVTRNANHS